MAKARKKHHVIIGASAAGLAALEAIRGVDRDCAITVLSKERGPLYSRVGLTHFLDGTVKVPGMNMAGVPTKYEGSMAMNVTSVLGLPIASLGLWQATDTTEHQIHTSLHESKRTYRKLVFKEGTLVGAILVGPHVNAEAGILHNFIRTRQSFTVSQEQLTAGPISWGRILRDNRMAGGGGPPLLAAAPAQWRASNPPKEHARTRRP